MATPEPTLTVSVEELPAVTDVGFRLTVGPAGETLALRLTVPADPLVTAVLMAVVPAVVQPLRLPVSKPPLVMPPLLAGVTVTVTVAL